MFIKIYIIKIFTYNFYHSTLIWFSLISESAFYSVKTKESWIYDPNKDSSLVLYKYKKIQKTKQFTNPIDFAIKKKQT